MNEGDFLEELSCACTMAQIADREAADRYIDEYMENNQDESRALAVVPRAELREFYFAVTQNTAEYIEETVTGAI